MDIEKKLKTAKELILEVETELIEKKGFVPYEVGYTLKNLDEAILQVEKILYNN